MIQVVFETHSTSEDNERRVASGWAHSHLSASGREQAARLGARRSDDGLAAVFASDLRRATETAEIAFADGGPPILRDWRLRECDYGERTRMPVDELHRDRAKYLDRPYPGGESWRQAVERAGRLLGDLPLRWNGTRVLVIGHVATHWALEHLVNHIALETLVASDRAWQEGWEYVLS